MLTQKQSGSNAQWGFTLIELLVGIAILGGLLAMATPYVKDMVSNAKIRTAAESITSGLQLARAEAVNRNAQVQFVLTAGTDSSWSVGCVTPTTGTQPCLAVIQSRSAAEGTSQVAVAANATSVAFNGFGAMTPTTITSIAPATSVGICVGNTGVIAANSAAYTACGITTERRLWVSVGTSGSVRMCDPLLVQPDPQAC